MFSSEKQRNKLQMMPHVCSALICMNKMWGFPPSLFRKVRFTVQERYPSLPCANLLVQSQLGTATEHCKGSTWKDLPCAEVASHRSFHSKSNTPNRQQGSITRNISKVVLPTLPRVRSPTSMFLEEEGCQILSVLL